MNKLSKFKAIISIDSNSVNPALNDFSSDLSDYQAKLTNDRSASRTLGMDYLMFAEGGLFGENQDLKKASGIFNLGQHITHRLMTTRGTMPGDSSFGVPWGKYLGATYSSRSFLVADLSFDIREEVLKDSRISEIQSIDISFLDPNTVEVNLVLVPVFTSINQTALLSINLTGGV